MSLALTGNSWILLIDWTMADGDVLRLSSAPYCTQPGDAPANTEYVQCVQSVPFSLAASDVLHRSGGGADPLTEIILTNPNKLLDLLMARPLRDTVMQFYFVNPGAAYSTKVAVASAYGDRVASYNRGTYRIKLRTEMDKLRQPVGQVVTFGDTTGQRGPAVFGTLEYTEGFKSDEADNIVTVNDLPIYGFSSLLEAGVSVSGSDYIRSREGVEALDLSPSITGKLAIGIRGSLWTTTQLVVNHEFINWTGDNPDDWTVTESPTNSEVKQNGSAEQARFVSDGTTLIVAQTILTPGDKYYLFAQCFSGTGTLEVVSGGVVIERITGAGTWRAGFIAAGSDFTLRAAAGGCDTIMDFVACYIARETDKINHLLYHLIVQRTGIDYARIDSVGAENIAAECPWVLGYQVPGEQTVFDTARQALDNVAGDIWASLTGIFKVGRLRDPSAETPLVYFDDSNIVPGTVTARHDEMTGLRTRIDYGRNFSVHADSDIDASVGAAARAILKREKLTASGSVTPNAHYTLTAAGAPRESWIRGQSDATAQIEHECGLVDGDSPAILVDWTAAVDPRIGLADLQPFQPVSVKSAVPGVRYGRKCLLLAISGDLVRPRTLRLLAWSPSVAGTLLLDDGGELLTDDGGGILLGGD